MSDKTDFEVFEQQFLKLIGELQLNQRLVSQLRSELAAEASRAECAVAEREASAYGAAEARAEAAAANAGTHQLGAALSTAHDELAAARTKLDIIEREKALLETRVGEVSTQLATARRELAEARAQDAALAAQRDITEQLSKRLERLVEEAQATAPRLESEQRRVERAAAAGGELRERARLAAAAHARERRLADAELRHTAADLLDANVKIAGLTVQLKEARAALGGNGGGEGAASVAAAAADWESRAAELRIALDTERAGAARLERALAAVTADNAALTAAAAAERAAAGAAANVAAGPAPSSPRSPPRTAASPAAYHLPTIAAIDSFLQE